MSTDIVALVTWALLAATLAALALYSVIENVLSRLTRVDIKLLMDRRKGLGEDRFVTQLHRGKYRVQIPLQLFVQSIRVATGLLILILLNLHQVPYAAPLALLATVAGLFFLSHWLPWAVTGTEPERALLVLLPFLRPVLFIGIPLTYPIILLAARRHAASADNEAGEDEITDEEVQAFLDVGEEEGIFEQEESRIIQQVVELGDTIAREIMVPRTEIVAIPVGATQEDLRALIVKSRHSRIPVYEGTIDAIVGVIYVRHLLASYSAGDSGTSFKGLIRPALYVPETKRVAELLREMQAKGEQMCIVVDEYGGVAGLVTLEDILEEIVGEIRDEDQPVEVDIHPDGDGAYTMYGDTDLWDVQETLGVDLDEEGYNTIAGLIIKELGRLPKSDETLRIDGLEIRVLEVDSRKIHRVRVRKLDAGR